MAISAKCSVFSSHWLILKVKQAIGRHPVIDLLGAVDLSWSAAAVFDSYY